MPYGGIFDLEAKQERLEEVNGLLEAPEIWSDQEQSQALGKERQSLQHVLSIFAQITQGLEDVAMLYEMAQEESDPQAQDDAYQEALNDYQRLEEQVKELEFERMFSQPLDNSDCYMDIQSGSGGTEAQDWAEMIMRMYLKFGEKHDFKCTVTDISEGDVAGIKGATIKFEGPHAYGMLRTETGIHRLVRKSPFDSNNRRHTSFCSAFVYPEVNNDIKIDINPADLKIDVFRSSGAGGQHINKTDSAIRITHIPTGIVVECQDQRSQHSNRARAMEVLISRLAKLEEDKRNATLAEQRQSVFSSGDRSDRIRTYNFPQSRVTDHRINLTLYRLAEIMEGKLDLILEPVIEEYQAEQLAAMATQTGL